MKFIMVRKILRLVGFHIHKGWEVTHPSFAEIVCVGCGEQRSLMVSQVEPPFPDWWETNASGDGSCGNIKEVPNTSY